jgi:hypothetical protein
VAWKFDPLLLDLVWSEDSESISDSIINFGTIEGDLGVDGGSRDNDISIIDQGSRL